MHNAAWAFVAGVLSAGPERGDVLEVGSLDINGSCRGLFPEARSYLGIDVVPGRGVDEVADGADYDPGKTFDLVLCCEVLEHTAAADRIVSNALRLLTPGGRLVVTCAGPARTPHSGVDGKHLRRGEYYRNVNAPDVMGWARDRPHSALSVVVTPDSQDLYAVIVR